MSDFRSAVKKAVAIVGGQTKLAQRIGCAQSEVSRLCTSASSIRAEVAIAISLATGRQILLSDLVPDVVKAVQDEINTADRSRDLPDEKRGVA